MISKSSLTYPAYWQQGALLGLLLFAVIILSACDQAVISTDIPNNNQETFQVAPVFQTFYSFLEGEEMLGPAISHLIEEDGRQYQFTAGGLMVYDKSSAAVSLFQLSPLVTMIGINEPAVPKPADESLKYVNGHIIGPEFVQYYEEKGSEIVGLPLTEMFYNRLRRRYEQYFENVAFYAMRDTGEVGLLAYGTLFCDSGCRKVDPGNGVIDFTYKVAPVFQDFVNQYGLRFTGFPLGEIISVDGEWIQVFQNIVLVASSLDQPNTVRLLHAPIELGILPQEPRIPSGQAGMNFYTPSGVVGYDVPAFFWDYLVAHGGLAISGAPITHLENLEENSQRQCFENLCLIFEEHPIESVRVYPEQLGYHYRALHGDSSPQPDASPERQRSALTLRVEESLPTTRPDQQQEIRVTVMRDGFPVKDVELEIVLTLPDGTAQSFILPATTSEGKTTQILPIIAAENGSVILYQVCVVNQELTSFCYEDSFTIWSQP